MLLGDYYPLTPYSLADNVWIGWQFHRPETGAGCVQAFRRAACSQPSRKLALRGLDPAETYKVKDFDKPGQQEFMGKELMDKGLPVRMKARGSAVFLYCVSFICLAIMDRYLPNCHPAQRGPRAIGSPGTGDLTASLFPGWLHRPFLEQLNFYKDR